MRTTLNIKTERYNELVDITEPVRQFLQKTNVREGLINIYVQGATAAIMIQENWDQSVQTDVINLMTKLIPNGVWEHDKQDGNGDSHLKAGIVGPSESVPVINGKLGLSTWQNIFLCEFDGPRSNRNVVVTIFEC